MQRMCELYKTSGNGEIFMLAIHRNKLSELQMTIDWKLLKLKLFHKSHNFNNFNKSKKTTETANILLP